jgi:hypothetical protein
MIPSSSKIHLHIRRAAVEHAALLRQRDGGL